MITHDDGNVIDFGPPSVTCILCIPDWNNPAHDCFGINVFLASLDEFDIAWSPYLREECLAQAIQVRDRAATLVGHGLDPVAELHTLGLFRAEVRSRGTNGACFSGSLKMALALEPDGDMMLSTRVQRIFMYVLLDAPVHRHLLSILIPRARYYPAFKVRLAAQGTAWPRYVDHKFGDYPICGQFKHARVS